MTNNVPTVAGLMPELQEILQKHGIPAYSYPFDEAHKERRRTMFTATDVPVLLGHNTYTTPRRVLLEKYKILPEWEGNDYTQAGHVMEPWLLSKALLWESAWLIAEAQEAHRAGDVLYLAFGLFVEHPALPLGATLDCAVVRKVGGTGDIQVVRIFEAKFTTSRWESLPMRVVSQCWAQADCAGLEAVDVVFFDCTGEVKTDVVETDALTHWQVTNAIETYWPYLSEKKVPEVDRIEKETPAPKIKGASQRVAASATDYKLESDLRKKQAELSAVNVQFNAAKVAKEGLETEVAMLKESLAEGLRLGVTKDLKEGIFYKSQKVVRDKPNLDKAREDYLARIPNRTSWTPAELGLLWAECVKDNTPRGDLSTTLTYRPNASTNIEEEA